MDNGDPYGYTGEWYEGYLGLLHLRARWLMPETGTFLSVDPVESEPPYLYVRGNPVNLVDPSGFISECEGSTCKLELVSSPLLGWIPSLGHLALLFTDETGMQNAIDAVPENDKVNWGEADFEHIIGIPGEKPQGDPVYNNPGKLVVNGPFEPVPPPLLAAIENSKAWPKGGSIIVAESKDVCKQWQCIKDNMDLIQKTEIAYKLLSANSNSAIYTTLRACELPTSTSILKLHSLLPWRSHPGWGIDLLSWAN